MFINFIDKEESKMADENTKPGYKTTEFWVTVVCQIIGILALAGVITPLQSTELSAAVQQLVGAVVMGASAFGYSLSRGSAKSE